MVRWDWIRRTAPLAAVLIAGVLCTAPTASSAFTLTSIGPTIGATDPDGVDGTVMFGGDLNFEQSGSRVHLQPNLLYWSQEGLSDVNPNFDVLYHFEPAGRVSPYLGAGVGLHFYSEEGPGNPGTDPGANLFAGLLIPYERTTFFVQGRGVLSDRNQVGILSGVLFSLGR